MNGIHDLGGMDGFGAVTREAGEPVFHAPWERRMFAMTIALFGRRAFNVDEFRHAIERMPPADYLRTTYYEHWLNGCERLLIEKGVVTPGELSAAYAANGGPDGIAPPAHATPPATAARRVRAAQDKKPRTRARFRVGDRIVARILNPPGHTRLPRYARGRRGVVRRDHGVFVFPDTSAHGGGANRQHCYTVEFAGGELWGRDYPAGARVMIDLWEDYLEAEKVPSRRIAMKPAGNPRTVAKPARIAPAKAKTGSRMRTR